MWLHHHYRFVIAAEMCHAWTPFGGIAAQLNHIAVLLSLATLESAGYAIRYHDLLVSTLADYARARFAFDYHTALSEVHEDTRRMVTREGPNASTHPPTAPNKGQGKGQKGPRNNPNKGTKGGKGAKGGKKGGKRAKGGVTPSGKGSADPTTVTAP